jgi:hypothetical protein
MYEHTSSITNNANSKTSSHAAQPYGNAGTELQERRVDSHLLLDVV